MLSVPIVLCQKSTRTLITGFLLYTFMLFFSVSSASSRQVEEGVGQLPLVVRRTQGLFGSISVQWEVRDGTAVAARKQSAKTTQSAWHDCLLILSVNPCSIHQILMLLAAWSNNKTVCC